METLTKLVIMAICFMALFNISAYAQNVTVVQPNSTEDVNEIVGSYLGLLGQIATAIGTIGTIIGVVAVWIKDKRTREVATQIGAGMSTFGQKTVEVLDKNRLLAHAFYNLSPEEAKKFLAENKADAGSLAESVKYGNEQLQTIEDQIGGKTITNIRAIKRTLPKEPFETRPRPTINVTE